MPSPRPLLLLLCIAAASASCAPQPGAVSVECRSSPASGDTGADTLRVAVHVDDPAGARRLRLLVRVDPLGERGAVLFEEGTPGTAAAAAIALTTSGTFQGCLSGAPSGFELRASAAPRGRVWLRVSSNVPVAARLTTGEDPSGSPGSGAHIVVSPGASGETVERAGT